MLVTQRGKVGDEPRTVAFVDLSASTPLRHECPALGNRKVTAQDADTLDSDSHDKPVGRNQVRRSVRGDPR